MHVNWKNNILSNTQTCVIFGLWVALLMVLVTVVGCGGNTYTPVTDPKVTFDGYYFEGRETCSEYRISFDDRDYLKEQLSPEEYQGLRDAFDEAVANWNAALTTSTLREVPDDHCVPSDIVVRYLDDITASYHTVFPNVSPCRCAIWMYMGLGTKYELVDAMQWQTLGHEIGHCQGLGHSSNPLNIMFQGVSDAKDILPINLEILEEHTVEGLVGQQSPNDPKCLK